MTFYDYIVITTIIIIGQIIPTIFSKLSAIISIPQTRTQHSTHASCTVNICTSIYWSDTCHQNWQMFLTWLGHYFLVSGLNVCCRFAVLKCITMRLNRPQGICIISENRKFITLSAEWLTFNQNWIELDKLWADSARQWWVFDSHLLLLLFWEEKRTNKIGKCEFFFSFWMNVCTQCADGATINNPSINI